ncbi:MAG TPA: filamentous hemagglutinin N-terminal domain-containing protein [Tepidisphaeraceae bacterium]
MKSLFPRFFPHFAALWLLLFASRARAGAVTLDGSFGHPAGPISSQGGIFSLTPAQGKTVGANLFFSLGQFSLDRGETASFSGPGTIANIITRVTAGPSTIDGKIQSTIPNANFYLINPAGVVFGPDATLDVSGSFVVTTASVLTLADGTKFAAPGPADALLTTAAPAAYGFLSSSAITVNGATIAVHSGENLAVISGSVMVQQGAILRASDGHVQVVAAGNSGTVQLDVANSGDPSLTAAPSDGELLVDKTSDVVADGIGKGQIDLIGQQVELQGLITAQTDGDGSGANIDVNAVQSCSIDGGIVTTKTSTTSLGGQISIQAGGILTINQGGSVSADTSLTSSAAGSAGNITISAGTLDLQTSGEILAQTSGAGSGGTIRINSNNVQISGMGETANVPTGLFADTTSHSTGAGGNIQLTANSLQVLSLGEISSTTTALGAGGSINVAAKAIHLNGGNLPGFTGIGANSQFTGTSAGAGGNISVASSTLNITAGAGISAGTFGPGAGGQVYAQSKRLVINGNNAPSNPTGLFAKSLSPTSGGNGGDIIVDVGQLDLRKAAQIAADSQGQGRAGNVTINATGASTLSTQSEIVVQSTYSDGGELTLDSRKDITLTNANLSSQAGGDGGDIKLQAADALAMQNTHLDASAGGTGGNITIDPSLIVLQNGQLNAHAIIGNGGNINIRAGQLLQYNTLINVSSTFGTAGTVLVSSSPAADIAGEVLLLRTDLINVSLSLMPTCLQMGGEDTSSFVPVGNGGAAIEPGGLLPSFVPDQDIQRTYSAEPDSK